MSNNGARYSPSSRFSGAQVSVLVLVGALWALLNWLWVHASGDVIYLHDDSISYVATPRQWLESYLRTPWWQWDIPVSPPPFLPLLTLAFAPWFADALHSGVGPCCFAIQATIMLASYAAVAWLGRLLYGPRAGVYSALFFLSFYMVESTVRNHQCDGLLGMMVTLMVAISWQMRQRRFSWGWCSLWALGLILSFMCKWSALWQWLGLFFLYHVCLLVRERATSLSGSLWSRSWRLGGEVLLWVALGLALSGLEYALDLRQVTALALAGVGIVGLRSYLRSTFPLRRFLIISGLGLTVCALMWFRALSDCYYQNVVLLNGTYSGALFAHIIHDWPGLTLELLLVVLEAVLLPVAGAVAVGCSVFSLARWHRWLPNAEMLCLIIIPGLGVNVFFFALVKARFFMAILGLVAVIMGSVLAEARSWLRWPILGWCLLAKLVFLGGWLICADLPEARDCYLQSNNMGMSGIYYRERNVDQRLLGCAKLHTQWSDSPLFTSYPYRLADMDLLYRVWASQARSDDALPASVLVATLYNIDGDVHTFHGDYYTLEEMKWRRHPQHRIPVGVNVNTSLYQYHTDDLVKTRSLVVLYTLKGEPEQRLTAVKRHVRTYLGDCAKLLDVYRSGDSFDCAVFRLEPGWENKLGALFSNPPTPLLSEPRVNEI